MKKLLTVAIICIMTIPTIVNANVDYSYEYKGKIYQIYYPEHIESLEYKYLTWKLDTNNKWFNLVWVNVNLTKRGLPSIW